MAAGWIEEVLSIDMNFILAIATKESASCELHFDNVASQWLPMRGAGNLYWSLGGDGPWQQQTAHCENSIQRFPRFFHFNNSLTPYISDAGGELAFVKSDVYPRMFVAALGFLWLYEWLNSIETYYFPDYEQHTADPRSDMKYTCQGYNAGEYSGLSSVCNPNCRIDQYRNNALQETNICTPSLPGVVAVGGLIPTHYSGIIQSMLEIRGRAHRDDRLFNTNISWQDVTDFCSVMRGLFPNDVPSAYDWDLMMQDLEMAFGKLKVAPHNDGAHIQFRYDWATMVRVMKLYLPDWAIQHPYPEGREFIRGTTTGFPPPPPPPGITLNSPTGGSVSGNQNITVTVSGPTVANTRWVKYKIISPCQGTEWIDLSGSGANWSGTWNTALVGDGPVTLIVRCEDGGGRHMNDSAALTVNNNWDPPPCVTVDSPADNQIVYGSSNIVFAHIFDNSSLTSVEYKIGSGSYTPLSGTTNGVYSNTFDVSSYPDGMNTFYIRAYDNQSQSTVVAIPIRIKNNRPPTVVISSPQHMSFVQDTVAVMANITDNDFITAVEVLYTTNSNKIGGTWFDMEELSAPFWKYDINTTLYPDRPMWVWVRAKDASDSWATNSIIILIQNEGIHVAWQNASDYGYVAQMSRTYDIEISSDYGTITEVKYTINSNVSWQDCTHVSGDTYRFTVNFSSGYSNGETVLLRVKPKDSTGWWIISEIHQVVESNPPPDVTIQIPHHLEILSNGSTTVQAYITDNGSIQQAQYSYNGTAWHALTAQGGHIYSAVWNYTSVADNSYNLYVRARDNNNKWGTNSIIVIIDLTDPPQINISAPNGTVSGNTPITATITDDQSVQGAQYQIDGTSGSWVSLPNTSGHIYSANWNSAAVSDGNHQVYIRAWDNQNVYKTNMKAFSVDNNPAPGITGIQPNAMVAGTTVGIRADVSTTLSIVSVQYQIDTTYNGSWISLPLMSGNTYGINNWNSTSINDGTHMMNIRAEDSQGQVTIASQVFVVNNNNLPIITFISPSGSHSEIMIDIRATVVDNGSVSTVEYKVDSATWATLPHISGDVYSIPWDSSGASSGSHTAWIRAVDNNAHPSTNSSIFTINRAPQITIIYPTNTVYGGSSVKAYVQDDSSSVSGVEYRINNGSWTGLPHISGVFYRAGFNTATYANDNYIVYVRAWDSEGNYATNCRGFSINNAPSLTCFGADYSSWTTDVNQQTDRVSATADSDITLSNYAGWSISKDTYMAAEYTASSKISGISFNVLSLDSFGIGSSMQMQLLGDYDTGLYNFTGSESGLITLTGISTYKIKFRIYFTTAPTGVAPGKPYLNVNNVCITNAGALVTAPPLVIIRAPASGSIVSQTVSVKADVYDERSVSGVQYRIDTGTWHTLSAGSGLAYSAAWDTTSESDGAHTLFVRAWDNNGLYRTNHISVNVNNAGGGLIPPSVTITSPSGTVSGSTSITATISDNGSVQGAQYRIDSGAWSILTRTGGTAQNGTWTATWNSTAVGNGAHTVFVRAWDDGSLYTTNNVSITVNNNTAPVVGTISSPSGTVSGASVSISAAITDDTGVTSAQYRIDSSPWYSLTRTGGTAQNGTWTATWNSTTVSDGTHTVYVRGVDSGGLYNTNNRSFTVNNNSGPIVGTISSPSGTVSGSSVSVSAAITDDTGVTAAQYRIDGGAWYSLTRTGGTAQNGTWTGTWNSTAASDGTHTVYVRGVDGGGLYNTNNRSFIVNNNAAPVVVSIVQPTAGRKTGNVSVQAYITDDTGVVSAQYRVDSGSWVSLSLNSGSPPSTGGMWIATLNSALYTDGTHTIYVRGVDGGSPALAHTNSISGVIFDNHGPVISAITPNAGSGNQSGSINISATISDASGISSGSTQYRIDNGGWQLLSGSGSTYTANGVSISSLVNGSHTLYVRAQDTQSLWSTNNATFTVLNNQPPQIVSVAPTAGSTVNNTINIDAVITDDTGVTAAYVSIDGGSDQSMTRVGGTVQNGTWRWSWNTTSIANGSHSIRIRAVDGGSLSDTSNYVLIVDNGGIIINITSPTAGYVTRTVNISAGITHASGIAVAEYRIGSSGGWISLPHTGGSTYAANWNTGSHSDGATVVYVRARNALNEWATNTVSVTIDNTAPVIVISTPVAGIVSGTVSINASSSSDATSGISGALQYRIDSGSWGNLSSGTGIWDTTAVSDGAHIIYVRGSDTVGLSATNSVSVTVQNNTAPAVGAISSPVTGVTYTGNVSVSAGITDNAGVITAQYRVDSGSWNTLSRTGGTTQNGTWTATINSTIYSDGTHTVYVRGVDGGTPALAHTNSVTGVVFDNTAPVITAITPNGGNHAGTINISANINDVTSGIATAEYRIDSGGWYLLSGSEPNYSANTVDISSFNNGSHTLYIRGQDTQGLWSTNNAAFTVANNQKPQVSIIAPSNGATVVNSIRLDVSAQDDNFVAAVSNRFDGGAWQAMTHTTGTTYTNWIDVIALGNGVHTIEVSAYDAAGLSSNTTISITVDHDYPPTVVFVTPTSMQDVSNYITVRVTAQDDHSVSGVDISYDSWTSMSNMQHISGTTWEAVCNTSNFSSMTTGTLYVRVRAANNQIVTNHITVNIVNNRPPIILSWTTNIGGITTGITGMVTVGAAVYDADTPISSLRTITVISQYTTGRVTNMLMTNTSGNNYSLTFNYAQAGLSTGPASIMVRVEESAQPLSCGYSSTTRVYFGTPIIATKACDNAKEILNPAGGKLNNYKLSIMAQFAVMPVDQSSVYVYYTTDGTPADPSRGGGTRVRMKYENGWWRALLPEDSSRDGATVRYCLFVDGFYCYRTVLNAGQSPAVNDCWYFTAHGIGKDQEPPVTVLGNIISFDDICAQPPIIIVSLKKDAVLTVTAYSVRGEKIAALVDGYRAADDEKKEVSWDGTYGDPDDGNCTGEHAGIGLYLIKVTITGNGSTESYIKKIMIK